MLSIVVVVCLAALPARPSEPLGPDAIDVEALRLAPTTATASPIVRPQSFDGWPGYWVPSFVFNDLDDCDATRPKLLEELKELSTATTAMAHAYVDMKRSYSSAAADRVRWLTLSSTLAVALDDERGVAQALNHDLTFYRFWMPIIAPILGVAAGVGTYWLLSK